MKAYELIAKLQEIVDREGNADVVLIVAGFVEEIDSVGFVTSSLGSRFDQIEIRT